jgi:hypothetical protein
MTGRIICLLGKSRAGKDTFAGLLEKELYTPLVTRPKFAAPMKTVLEYLYDLPENSLEDQEVRKSKVPGLDKTYLDIMVAAYHNWRAVDPYIVLRKTLKTIKDKLTNGYTVILTDLRSPEEALEINKLSHQYPLHLGIVSRAEAVGMPSDESLPDNISTLMSNAHTTQVVNNNKDLAYLESQAKTFINRVFLYERKTAS